MVSLGLVGEVFEVRTQVDRDLTTVSRVDRQLRLIKNLGRHIIQLDTVSYRLHYHYYFLIINSRLDLFRVLLT
jgi:hypothetical protein